MVWEALVNKRKLRNMREYKNLRIFLIRKFISTIILVSVAEYGILSVLNQTLIPFVFDFFFGNADPNYVSGLGIVLVLLGIIGGFLAQVISMIIPDSLRFITSNLLSFMNRISNNQLSADSHLFDSMTVRERVLLFVILLVIALIIITPYVIAAFFYARLVIKEVRIIEEQDIKKRKEYENQRNLMLSDIAHDLRTPITTMSGYSKALADGMVPEDKRQEYLDAIQVKSKRVDDLINLLFDYVKLENEGFSLNLEELDICELVRETGAFQYQDIEDAGMELEVDIPEERHMIKGDRLQLSRVITNLITNAIRHNPDGSTIGLFVTADEETIRIMVADQGEQIDKNYAEHIFEPFVVGDESRSTKGGTGLGLSIARKVVEMHGFRIRLVQKPSIRKYSFLSDYNKMFMITIRL